MNCHGWLLALFVWVLNSALVKSQSEQSIVCTHTRSLFNTAIGIQKCFYECCAIADICKVGNAPKNPFTDPWVVNYHCFDIEKDTRTLSCEYHTLESQVIEPEVYSGFVWARQGEVHTVTFPSSLQNPIVFAQAIICAEFHKFAAVRVAEVTALSFKLRLDLLFKPEEAAHTPFGIAWIAFNQWTGITEYRGLHMNAFKLDSEIGKSLKILPIRDRASNRVAIFTQVYSFSSELKSLNYQYQNGKMDVEVQHINGIKSNENKVTCGILMVDMSYYSDEIVHKFGPLKFIMAPSIFSSGNSFIYTATLARPYLFYTPYYYRGSGNDVPKLHYMCQWEDFKKDGSLQCAWRNDMGVYDSLNGIYGAYFIIEGDVVPRQDYKATVGSTGSSSPCTNVKSILAFTKSSNITYRIAAQMIPLELSTKTDTPLILQIDNMDRECFDRCVKHLEECKSDVMCLQNYLWPSCNLIWNDPDAKTAVQKEEQEELKVKINYDDVFEELQKSICPSHTTLAKIGEIKQVDLALRAEGVCSLYKTVVKNSRLAHPLLVVTSGLVSSDVCDKILAKEPVTKATWFDMSYMEETLVPRGTNSALNMQLLVDNFNLCAFCRSANEVITFQTLVKDFETVYAPDSRHNYNDCIESEWGPWGACQADCIPENGTVVRQRTRGILHPASGYGRPCKTIDIEDCSKILPSCTDFCALSQWSEWSKCENSRRHRNRYIQYYTLACEGTALLQTEECTVEATSTEVAVDETKDTSGKAEEVSMLQTDNLEESAEKQSTATDTDKGEGESETEVAAALTPSLQEPAALPSVDTDDQCSIWSQWSGCTSGCAHATGVQYRVQGRMDGSLCQRTEKRECKGASECGLQDQIDCAQVVPAYYSDVTRTFCTEECQRLLNKCTSAKVSSGDGSAPGSGILECFARQRLESPFFFSKCQFPNQVEDTLNTLQQVFQNQCFIARAGYSVADSSWVDSKNQSCICSIYGAVACSAMDVHANKAWIDDEMRDSIFCPIAEVNNVSFHHKKDQGTPDSLTYIALADRKRLHCPLSLNGANELTFGSFGSEESLRDFCQHGPLYELYKAKLDGKTPVDTPLLAMNHKYDCSIVKSKNTAVSTEQCRAICNNVDSFCSLKGDTIGKCVNDRLTNPKYQDYALFQKHTCKLPSDPKYNFNDDCQAIHLYTYNEQRKKACMTICRNALMHCQAEILTKSERTREECMKTAFGHGTTKQSSHYNFLFLQHSIDSFKKNCRFDLRLQTGGGYVLCKFPPQECQYGEWSDWSSCTRACNDFGNIATRYRTRERLGADNSICHQTGLGTLEFGICTHLGGCSNGKWFDDAKEHGNSSRDPYTNNNVIDYKAFGKGNKSDLAEWVTNAYTQYPELKDDVRCSKNCRIFKSVKISAKDTTTCGCPKRYKPCSFSMAVSSPQWFEQMAAFCKDKPMASVTFEGVIGIYKYYCHIGMLLMQLETSAELACEYVDNNEYIACVAQVERVFKPTALHFLMLGSGCAVLFALYITIRTLIHHRKLKSQRDAIFSKKTQ